METGTTWYLLERDQPFDDLQVKYLSLKDGDYGYVKIMELWDTLYRACVKSPKFGVLIIGKKRNGMLENTVMIPQYILDVIKSHSDGAVSGINLTDVLVGMFG